MATRETWDKVAPFFKPQGTSDQWGHPHIISDEHVLRLYDFRVWLGVPIYITAGVKQSGHSKKSFHYPRKINGESVSFATDLVIPDYKKTAYDLVLDANRFGFSGIGYYPHWQFKGRVVGGLHLDSRPLKRDEDGSFNYAHNRWMGVLKDGSQQYIPLTFENLKLYCSL